MHKLIKKLKFRIPAAKYIIALLLLALSIGFYNLGVKYEHLFLRGDFWVNLSAGTVGSMITIFFIDTLINRDKRAKLKTVNKLAHTQVLSATRHCMARYMLLFDYIEKDDFLDALENGETKFVEFIESDKYKIGIKQLDKFELKTASFLEKLQKETEFTYKRLTAALEEVKPYPNPLFMEYLKLVTPEFQGRISVGIDLTKFYYRDLPKKIAKKEANKMQPGMDVLWKVYAHGFSGTYKSLKAQYDELFKLLLTINDKALKEEVFYEVN